MKKMIMLTLVALITILPLTTVFAAEGSGSHLMMLDEKEKIFVVVGTNVSGNTHTLSLWQYDPKLKTLINLETAWSKDEIWKKMKTSKQ
jgi:hypothetical protein